MLWHPAQKATMRSWTDSIKSSAAPLPFHRRFNYFTFAYSHHTPLPDSINPFIPSGKHKHANKAVMQRSWSRVCTFEWVGKSPCPRGWVLCILLQTHEQWGRGWLWNVFLCTCGPEPESVRVFPKYLDGFQSSLRTSSSLTLYQLR